MGVVNESLTLGRPLRSPAWTVVVAVFGRAICPNVAGGAAGAGEPPLLVLTSSIKSSETARRGGRLPTRAGTWAAKDCWLLPGYLRSTWLLANIHSGHMLLLLLLLLLTDVGGGGGDAMRMNAYGGADLLLLSGGITNHDQVIWCGATCCGEWKLGFVCAYTLLFGVC